MLTGRQTKSSQGLVARWRSTTTPTGKLSNAVVFNSLPLAAGSEAR